MIHVTNLTKTFHDGSRDIEILKGLSLSVPTGQKVAIIGPSGSGKSTLLSLISGLDRPTSGSVVIDGVDIASLTEKDLAVFRNQKVSIVFQSFELVQFFSAHENVMLPLAIRSKPDTSAVDQIFREVELSHRQNNMPSTLSGGEQQRVAIARTIAAGSEIIFADEPTGNLDAKTGAKILDLLLRTVASGGKTLVVITHDMNIAKQMDVIYRLEDGKLVLVTAE